MKRPLVIGFLAILVVGGVSSAYAQGRIHLGVRVGLAHLVMADLNDTIAMINDDIEWHLEHEELSGMDVISSDELEEIRWGTSIEGYLGTNITDTVALRLIGGYLVSRESSGGFSTTDGTAEATATHTFRASCYFGGVEPVVRFDSEKASGWLGAGVAYYSATLISESIYELSGVPTETESSMVVGGKLGYHGFLEERFTLADGVSVQVSIGYRSTGKIELEGHPHVDSLDFSGMRYLACIVLLI